MEGDTVTRVLSVPCLWVCLDVPFFLFFLDHWQEGSNYMILKMDPWLWTPRMYQRSPELSSSPPKFTPVTGHPSEPLLSLHQHMTSRGGQWWSASGGMPGRSARDQSALGAIGDSEGRRWTSVSGQLTLISERAWRLMERNEHSHKTFRGQLFLMRKI